MKRYIQLIYALFVFLGIASIFAPLLVVSNTYCSLINCIKIAGISSFSFVIPLSFIFFITGSILLFFIKRNKSAIIVSFVAFLLSGILILFTKSLFKSSTSISSQISVTVILISVCSLFLCLYLSGYIFDQHNLTVQDIVEIGIFVSFALVLDFSIFKIRIGQTGGSISFVTIPLIIICIRKGFFKGFIATGIVYGLINCLLDGYGLMFYPFDYLLGFGSIALIGIFSKTILDSSNQKRGFLFMVIGITLAFIGRTLAATASGMIFYHMNFISSLVYQLTYIGPSSAIALVVMAILFKPLLRVNRIFSHK